VHRLGLPVMRTATRQAMRLLGSHFVLGQTIEEALSRARHHADWRYSFDMLGEGARTTDDADIYFDHYAHAITAIGKGAKDASATRSRRSGSSATTARACYAPGRPGPSGSSWKISATRSTRRCRAAWNT
jgi:proline dehydrogenase